MEYEGTKAHQFVTAPLICTLDGDVCIEEHITYRRYIPRPIYEIDRALKGMSEDEIIQIMDNITKITHGRVTFDMEIMIKILEWQKFDKNCKSKRVSYEDMKKIKKATEKKIAEWRKNQKITK